MFLTLEEIHRNYKIGDREGLITELMTYKALVTKDKRERKTIFDKLGIEYNESFFDDVKTEKYKKKLKAHRQHINKYVADIGNSRKGFLTIGKSLEATKHKEKHIVKEHIVRIIDTVDEIIQMTTDDIDGWGNLDFTNESDTKKVFDRIFTNAAVILVCENKDRIDGIRENSDLEVKRKEIQKMSEFLKSDEKNIFGEADIDMIKYNSWVRGELPEEEIPSHLVTMGLTGGMDLYALCSIQIVFPTDEEKEELRRDPHQTYYYDLTQRYVLPYIRKTYTPQQLRENKSMWSDVVKNNNLSKKKQSLTSKVSDKYFGMSTPGRL